VNQFQMAGRLVCALVLALDLVHAENGPGADGNPHGWDRRRRCDGTMYKPACGTCEGYGGIPYGDKNEEITLSTCEPVTDDPARKKIQPIWSTRMTMAPYYSVQIGPKKDPFCFQAIPENTSAGALCYQRQTGSQVYEMGKYNALRFDVNLATGAGNVTSAVIAQGPYLWIVNHLPWYALGVKQCICTQPKEGGDAAAKNVYPLQYNWTNRMSWIGLEEIYVEYVYKNMTLDHWVYGPHHVWTVPTTGSIIRMWQPFNGLQVMPNGTLISDIDPALFDPIPPVECTSASKFTFKIKCNASGYPVKPPSAPPSAPPMVEEDEGMWRTVTKVPRHKFKGESFSEMAETLNSWLAESAGEGGTKPCDEWNVTEIQKLQAMLYLLRFPAYDDVYKQADDNRQLLGTIDDMQQTWEKLNAAAEESGLGAMHRDGHCHEAVMWFTHHLQEDAKKLLRAQGVVLPLLSRARHDCPAAGPGSLEGRGAVCAGYDYKVSCSDCHANVGPEPSKRHRLLAAAAESIKLLFA